MTTVALIFVAWLVNVAAALALLCLLEVFSIWRLLRTLNRERTDIGQRTTELRGNYESILSILSSALGLSDGVNADSQKRVSRLAAAIAWQLGMRKEQIKCVEQAAILHDVGKIGIAQAVLSQSGALSEDEWKEMRRHPETGHEILSQVDFLDGVADIVRAHHERFDGQGYPRGLKGEAIPLGSRIYAVADAYVAMTTEKPYRKAMEHALAVREVVRHSLTQFDPEVVRAFLDAERAGLVTDTHRVPSRSGLADSLPAIAEI